MSSSRSSYYSSPYLPARPAEKAASPPKPTPSSPPRKVVTDFKAFGAAPTASVFGTAVQSTPFSLAGGKAAFGAVRNNGRSTTFDDDEEDDEDDGKQRVELREDSITLDQVRGSRCGACTNAIADVPVFELLPGATHRDAERVEKHAHVSWSPGSAATRPRHWVTGWLSRTRVCYRVIVYYRMSLSAYVVLPSPSFSFCCT